MTIRWWVSQYGLRILASVMLGRIPVTVCAQGRAGRATSPLVISDVTIVPEPQRAAVRIEGVGIVNVHPVRLQNPERLVLDFVGVRLTAQRKSISGAWAPVRAVRLGQFRSEVARVIN